MTSKRRQRYRPFHPLGVTAMDRLLARIEPMPERPLAAFYTALEMIARQEHPGEAEWRDLADIVNVVETLMLDGRLLREEVEPLIAAGTAGMAAAGYRWRDGHGVRLDAAGLQAMRRLLEVYEACRAELSTADMEAARRATANRVRLHRMGHRTGAEVVEV